MAKEEKKYIHYCWFGDAKLSRLAKKCMKSWKKYLPDYEIIFWNNDNVDFDACPFVKEAYEQKKWAFVADYVRTKALYEYGGIYLDTDMKIIKDIKFLLKNPNFIGVEDSGAVAVGVWGVKEPGDKFVKELLDFYESQSHFNSGNLYAYTIPVIITKILSKYGFQKNKKGKQVLDNKKIYVYPREYFYPLSYNYHNNDFTKNTCMIHYYDASWTSKEERRTIWLIRKVGPKMAAFLLKAYSKIKALLVYYGGVLRRTIQLICYPARFMLRRVQKNNNQETTNKLIRQIGCIDGNYVAFSVSGWLGVNSSTISMFKDVILVPESLSDNEYKNLAKAISKNSRIKTIIFSGFMDGWSSMIGFLKSNVPNVRIKVFWHGSNAMHIDGYDWDKFKTCFSMLDNGMIDEIAFAKKSMFEQYKKLGYKVAFLPNNLIINKKVKKQLQKNNDKIRIGIYASGDRWVKNFYNQLAAASLVDNAEVDVIPMSDRAIEFARILHVDLYGVKDTIPRDELLDRIAQNDVVLYTTFVECAPILPLECLELGVICITGDNHHYWDGTALKEYLVEPRVDNPVAIAERIEKCLKHKDEIFKLYKTWKKQYNKYCADELKKFIDD